MRTLFNSLVIVLGLFSISAAQAATVLVTGSNRGLGLEFVRQYAAAGWTVIATARNLTGAAELQALASAHKNIALKTLDVVDDASVKALVTDLNGMPIDVLINNAGVLGEKPGQTLGSFNQRTFQQVMITNAYAPLAISDALRANVAASTQKKIVAITSGAGIISFESRGGNTYFYSASKTALNMLMRGLAADVRRDKIIVGVIAPGAVDTDMRREVVGSAAANDQRPEDSVASMRQVIENLTPAQSGLPLNYDGQQLPW